MKLKYISLQLLFLLLFMVHPAIADVEIDKLPGTLDSFTLGMDVRTFYRVDKNPYFGAEGTSSHGVENNDVHWGEVFARFRLTAAKDLGWTNLTAQIAPFFAETSDQDVYGLADDTSQVGLDQGWLEFDQLFDAPVSLKMGRQDVMIEKMFLVGSSYDMTAAGWWFCHYSFPFAVKLQAEFDPLSVTAFYARPGGMRQTGDIDLAGLNLHLDLAKNAYLYGGLYRQFDGADTDDRDIDIYDIGGEWDLSDRLIFEGEYAHQGGELGNLKRDASAWFGSAKYSFPVRLSPYIRASYVYYSGDKDPTDNEVNAWDPFYKGFGPWNHWVQGCQTGGIWLDATNKKVAMAEFGFMPIERMNLSLHYLNTKLDEKASLGTQSDHWGDEIDLYIDYQVSDHFYTHVGAGVVVPGDAAEEAVGDDKTPYFGQIALSFCF